MHLQDRQLHIRTDTRTDGRQTDLGTKIIYPFLVSKQEEIAGCFIFTSFLMSCDSQCSVTSLALPHGAVGRFAVCDCGIS